MVSRCSLLNSTRNHGSGQSSNSLQHRAKNYSAPGRQSPNRPRLSNIDPTQSPIRLRPQYKSNRKYTSPLCERSDSGECERQSCKDLITQSHSDSSLLRLTANNLENTQNTRDNIRHSPKGSPNRQRPRTPCKGAAGCCRELCCRMPGNENKVCDPLCPFHKERSVGLVHDDGTSTFTISLL